MVWGELGLCWGAGSVRAGCLHGQVARQWQARGRQLAQPCGVQVQTSGGQLLCRRMQPWEQTWHLPTHPPRRQTRLPHPPGTLRCRYIEVNPAFEVDWGRDLGQAFNFR